MGQINTNLSIFENNQMNLKDNRMQESKIQVGGGLQEVKNCRTVIISIVWSRQGMLWHISNVSKPLIMITKATRREVTGKGKTRQRCAALRFGPLLLLPKNIFASNALFYLFKLIEIALMKQWSIAILQYVHCSAKNSHTPFTLGKLGAHLFVNRISSNLSDLQNLVKASA